MPQSDEGITKVQFEDKFALLTLGSDGSQIAQALICEKIKLRPKSANLTSKASRATPPIENQGLYAQQQN